jgi:tetratricopeptide (TPR) repeat protein
VILSTATLEDLSIGVLHGIDPASTPSDELLLSAGSTLRRETPFSSLQRRVWDRERNAQALMAERLSAAENGGVAALIAAGLGSHYAAQEHSSPYETIAQRIELNDEALGPWSTAALATPLARPTRELVSAAGRALRGKRAVTQIYEHLDPISEAHPAWVELIEILCYADLEALDPSHCIHRVESALALGAETPTLLVYLSDALVQLGRASDAVEHLWRAYAELPNNQEVRERLAIALVRAGDKEGRAMIEDLLLEDPDKEHLRPYLVNGPLPSASTGYIPFEFQTKPSHPEDDHEGHNH